MVEDALLRIVASGKAAGILTSDKNLARRYIDIGATFVAVGTDVGLFSTATSALAASFKADQKPIALQVKSDTTY